MKSLVALRNESEERAKTRYVDRKEIGSRNYSVRQEIAARVCSAGQSTREAKTRPEETINVVTYEALKTAELALHQVDKAMDALESLRLELVEITIGEGWTLVEGLPRIEDLGRALGELTALLKIHDYLEPRWADGTIVRVAIPENE